MVGERWIWRPLFIFALLLAFIRGDILFNLVMNVYNFGGLAYFIAFSAAWALYTVPFAAVQMGLGHFLRGPVGIFSTFPALKSFGWGLVLYHVLWTPYFAMRSAHYGHHFYIGLHETYYKSVAMSCGQTWNSPSCVEINSKNSSAHIRFSPLEEYWRFFNPIPNPDKLLWEPESPEFGIPKNINWQMASVCCVVFAFAMLVLTLGPVLFGPAALLLFLGFVVLLATFGAKVWNLPGGAIGRKLLLESMDFDRFTLPALYSVVTDALVVGTITTGIIPTLASFNFPSSCHLNVIEIILSLILVPGIYFVFTTIGFTMAGYLSLELNLDMDYVIVNYFSKPLTAFPHVIAKLSPENHMLWILLFYFFGALLWLMTTIVMMEVICSGIVNGCENVTDMKRICLYRPPISIIVTLCLAALALLLCCRNYVGLVPLFETDILALSMPLNQTFVFLQLFIFIAYGTIKLFSSHTEVRSSIARYAAVSLMILFVFILMLFTILYIALVRIKFDLSNNLPKTVSQISTRDIVVWCIASAPVVIPILLLPIIIGVLIIRAKRKESSVLEALFYPNLTREYTPATIQVNSFYGEFDYANSAPL